MLDWQTHGHKTLGSPKTASICEGLTAASGSHPALARRTITQDPASTGPLGASTINAQMAVKVMDASA